MPRTNEHITGLNHPKNQYCEDCDSPPGFWCLSKTGLEKKGWKNQHAVRLRKADLARGGQMIGGEFVPFEKDFKEVVTKDEPIDTNLKKFEESEELLGGDLALSLLEETHLRRIEETK